MPTSNRERQAKGRQGRNASASKRELAALPDRLGDGRRVFSPTGRLHAAGLVHRRGELIAVGEDVGWHNTVGKAVDWTLLGGCLPLTGRVLLVGGCANGHRPHQSREQLPRFTSPVSRSM